MSVIPWAYTKLEDYQNCPRMFYAKWVAKSIVDVPSEQMLWGRRVHTALEKRLTEGQALSVEEGFAQYEPFMAQLEKAPGQIYCELKLAITVELKSAEFFDNNNAWNRGVEDILILNKRKALVGDYKTGKKKPKSRQLAISAIRVFSNFEDVDELTSCFFWLPLGPTTSEGQTRELFRRDDMNKHIDYFFEEVAQLEWSEKNNAWPAKPNGLCKAWCLDFSCPHNGRRAR